MRLTNKVVLVTGTTQGIGLGIAERLAKEGADIIIDGRVEDERSSAASAQAKGVELRTTIIFCAQIFADRVNGEGTAL